MELLAKCQADRNKMRKGSGRRNKHESQNVKSTKEEEEEENGDVGTTTLAESRRN